MRQKNEIQLLKRLEKLERQQEELKFLRESKVLVLYRRKDNRFQRYRVKLKTLRKKVKRISSKEIRKKFKKKYYFTSPEKLNIKQVWHVKFNYKKKKGKSDVMVEVKVTTIRKEALEKLDSDIIETIRIKSESLVDFDFPYDDYEQRLESSEDTDENEKTEVTLTQLKHSLT